MWTPAVTAAAIAGSSHQTLRRPALALWTGPRRRAGAGPTSPGGAPWGLFTSVSTSHVSVRAEKGVGPQLRGQAPGGEHVDLGAHPADTGVAGVVLGEGLVAVVEGEDGLRGDRRGREDEVQALAGTDVDAGGHHRGVAAGARPLGEDGGREAG